VPTDRCHRKDVRVCRELLGHGARTRQDTSARGPRVCPRSVPAHISPACEGGARSEGDRFRMRHRDDESSDAESTTFRRRRSPRSKFSGWSRCYDGPAGCAGVDASAIRVRCRAGIAISTVPAASGPSKGASLGPRSLRLKSFHVDLFERVDSGNRRMRGWSATPRREASRDKTIARKWVADEAGAGSIFRATRTSEPRGLRGCRSKPIAAAGPLFC